MNLRLKRAKELAGYALTLTRQEGPAAMLRRAAGFAVRRMPGRPGRYLPAKEVLEAQRRADTSAFPLISVCTPLYNTPKEYLEAFLDSLQAQTCPRWQLCLADASDEDHSYVGRLVAARGDERIRYAKIENKGIAANTNAAAALAGGEYLALADHDDLLAPHAIYAMGRAILKTGADFLYSDEALFEKSMERARVAHFKPDFAPEYLLGCNYICHLAVFRRSLFEEIGGERAECDGAQDYDLFWRLIDAGAKPYHLPQVLYYWRVHAGSTSGGDGAKPYVQAAGLKTLADHLARTGQKGTPEPGLCPGTYRVRWQLEESPLVSILIPNKDHIEDLKKCLDSVYQKTEYRHFEVLVLENNSEKAETFEFYGTLPGAYPGCRVEKFAGAFNFSALNNFGRARAKGEYLLMLNNDVEVINGQWLGELVAQASRPGVAIAGAMLFYPDDTVQHGGVITGLGGYAGHSHKYHRRGASGYMFRLCTVQDFSAVTAACLLVRASVFDEVGGMDEAFTVAFNDVDFCLRVRKAGWRVVWTPYAQLYHYESKSRGLDEKDPAKKARFEGERARLYQVHGRENILRDPYYSPSLTLDREDFGESADLRNLKHPEE